MDRFTAAFTCKNPRLDTVGGKGANLAELRRAGFAVPPGFSVTTTAYKEFVGGHGLGERILAVVSDLDPEDLQTLDSVSKEIRAWFTNAELNEEIQKAIATAYSHLVEDMEPRSSGSAETHGAYSLDESWGGAVAVRSSATAEDLPGASFAGQQDTFLNVIGVKSVCEAVKKCWGSLWTARALAYRSRNRIAADRVAMAVVVQEMIPAEASGVLFTANPLTGHRSEIVIDASFGLGEAVVSGQVEPDHYVVDAREGVISSSKLGAKAIVVIPRASGDTEVVEQKNGERRALEDGMVLELARVGRRVAEHFGAPQDIEWALAGGQVYLLQARPITSLYPLPLKRSQDREGLRVYVNFSAIQGVMGPLTPLGRASLRMFARGLGANASGDFVVEAGGRVFLDVTGMVHAPGPRKVLLAAMAKVEPGVRLALLELTAEGRLARAKGGGERRRQTPLRRLRFIWGRMKRIYRARRLLMRVLGGLLQPERARARALGAAEGFWREVDECAARARDLPTSVAAWETSLEATPARLHGQLIPVIAPVMLMMELVDKWLVQWLGQKPGCGLELMKGLPGNVTVEMDLRLWTVAQAIRRDSSTCRFIKSRSVEELTSAYCDSRLPSSAQDMIEGFLRDYGMRGMGEIDIGRRRWRDDPKFVLQTLVAYLEVEDPDLGIEDTVQQGAAESERLWSAYVSRAGRTPLGWIRGRLLNAAIRRMRLLGGLRELPKWYFVKIVARYREILLERGRELARLGTLEVAEDIFFVPFEELKRFSVGEPMNLKALADRNREEYEKELSRRQVPRLLLSTGEVFYHGLGGSESSDLIGDGVSPGVVDGKVRVVVDPQGQQLERGEILVCASTDPGWTPLFLTAGGLVMERGGLVTHGAVVAREYGLPAVAGVHHATETLKTGQRVRVDGSAGRVTLIG